MIRLCIVVAVVSLLAGYGAGWYVNGLRWEKDWLSADKVARELAADKAGLEAKIRSEREGRLAAVDKAAVLERALADAEGEVIIKEVLRYVQSDTAGDCSLPDDWVRIHNAAAGVPRVPDAPAVDAREAETARTDSDALPVIASNYRRCREAMTRLEGLQAWTAQAAKFK
ncbi:hypothetical protein [uncultured Gilvimarinus sp.]|uniref:hypothetical protein n=1 Tax=uncultured Gilvimarinus sp. TaxID=1689143 RepID=UPI0030D967CC